MVMANTGSGGCQRRAAYTVKTVYGTYRLCAICHSIGHLDIDAARGAKTMSPASNPIPDGTKCECEHVKHDQTEDQ